MQEAKKDLRGRYLRMRKALSRESVESRSYRIIQQLGKMITDRDNTLLFYIPINNEVDLLPLVRDLYIREKSILFPKVINYENIVPCLIQDLYSDFKPGAYNIPEPDTGVYQGGIDAAFVPGIVFGKDNFRIGYGKGYYDRFLKTAKIGKTIGVCFDFQVVDSVPHTERDSPLDYIVCESGVINAFEDKGTSKN